jgi:hypothetical protein
MFKIYLTSLLLIVSFNMFSQQATPLDEILNCLNSLHITKFEGNKTWKAVVGIPVTYESKPRIKNPDPNLKWNWEIGEGSCSNFTSFWTVASLNGDFERARRRGLNITSMPTSNEDFGDKNGLIKVSNSINNIPNEESCVDKNGNEAKVKVFFEKDAMNNPDGTVPNWFYYWSQISLIQDMLNSVSGFVMYDRPKCQFEQNTTPVRLNLEYAGSQFPYNPSGSDTLGTNLFNVANMAKEDLYSATPPSCIPITAPVDLAIVSYGNAEKIQIGEGCGFQKLKDVCNPSGVVIEGIHAFYSTVAHEVEHARITSEVWSFTHPNEPNVEAGYLWSYDEDLDGYKDIWEELSADGMTYGFNSDPSTGGGADKYDPNYLHCFCSGTCSAGTQYEETRCRNVEQSLNLNAINAFDWSFDPTNTHQGKQW